MFFSLNVPADSLLGSESGMESSWIKLVSKNKHYRHYLDVGDGYEESEMNAHNIRCITLASDRGGRQRDRKKGIGAIKWGKF